MSMPICNKYDFTAQALSKLSRGYERDIDDVQAMYEQKLFSLEELRNGFNAIEPDMIRFPSLNSDALRGKIEKFVGRSERQSKDDYREPQ
jgi:hypothetical protein